jgi:tRNA(fMet)-specific endonuclease VapC
MIRFILDTNVLVDVLKGRNQIARKKLLELGIDHCAIADITVFELLCGVANSANPEKNRESMSKLIEQIQVLPSSTVYREAADHKIRLKNCGALIEDVDLLIGCTALHYGLTLVTGNLQHMQRIEGLNTMPW